MGPKEYLATTIVGTAGAAGLLLAVAAGSADAAPAVTCSAATGTVTVAVSGTATGGDGLRITTSSGDYSVSLNGGAVCTNQTWSDSVDRTIQVTESTQTPVPATFAPGTDNGITFIGDAVATNTLDLVDQGAGTSVTLTGPADSAQLSTTSWSGHTDSFSGVTTVSGAGTGSTTFVASSGGGWTLAGVGSGNALDLSALPTPPTADLFAGTALVGPSATDSISGISTVIGSTSAATTFVAGGSTETFIDHRTSGSGSTIDFSHVPTSGAARLALNLSGVPEGATPAHAATVGGTTYSFSSGSARFTGFVGPSTGFTDVVADATTGWSFTGGGGGNTLDLSAVNSPATADLDAGDVQIGTGSDSFSGVSTVIGSSAAHTTFVAGAGNETFVDPNALSTIDFSHVAATSPSPLLVNLTSGLVAGIPSRSATAGTSTYTFTSGAAAKTAVVGASVGHTTVYADSTTGYAITQQGSGNTLDLSNAPAGVTVDVAHGTVTIGAGSDSVTGLNSVVGSASGQTAFVASAAGGNTFQGIGASNVLDLSGVGAGPTADLSGGVAQLGGGATDAFSDISRVIGSAAGGTTFVAGSVNENFADPGSTGAGDSIDFSHVATSSAVPLVVNVSGAPISGTIADHTAAVGTTTYSFTSHGDRFTSFEGPTTGYGDFVSHSGGYTFLGQGGPNTLDLSAAPSGPAVDLVTGVVQVGTAADATTGITRVIGSVAGGTSYIAAPQANETFSDPSSSGSPGATLDLSQLDTSSAHPLTVNVTSGPAGGAASNAAAYNGYNYDFSQGADRFTTIDGPSAGEADFLAGTSPKDFVAGGPANTLDLSALTWPLTINAATGLVTSVSDATWSDTFSGMRTLVGSSSGGTHFVAGSSGGFAFRGLGSSNVLDFHPATSGPTVNAVLGQADLGAGETDTFSGISSYAGAALGDTTFIAPAAPGATFMGLGTGNSVDFSQVADGITADLSTGAVTVGGGGDSLSGIQKVIGSTVNDMFTQESPGSFDIVGGGGVDTLGLTVSPATVTETSGDPACSSATHDGTATGSGLDDQFACLSSVVYTGAPANPIATGAVAQKGGVLSVGWVAPSDTGGSPVTGYSVYCSTSPSPAATGTPTVSGIPADATATAVSGLTSGTRYYCIVTASNGNGESPGSSTVSAVPDATAPKVTLRSPTARFDLTAHATTTFTASDASGVRNYDVRYRVARFSSGFGSWVYPSGWQATTSKTETKSIAAGSEVCFEVRARDVPGNTSGWSGQRCTARPLDDRGLAMTTKGWTRAHDNRAYLGTVTSTTTKAATLKATGAHFRYLALVVTRCATCGHVAIYLNGHLWKTVSTYATRTSHQVLLVEARTRVAVETVTLKATDAGKHVVVDGLGCSQ